MKELNYKTKKAQRFIELYKRSTDYCLSDVYGNGGSNLKNIAENNIIRAMNDAHGHGYKILSHSHMFFTTGWLSEKEGYLIVDTASETYMIKLPF